jgi:signal transduction histidine kinase
MPLRLVALVVATLLALPALAEERATTKEAEGLVKSAIAFLKKEGKAKAFAAFSDPKGSFAYRDLYIAAYDHQGKCLAHGQKPERVGKVLLEDKDADGKAFVKERIALIEAKGKGWQEYKFQNPATKKVEDKVAYCEDADGAILCAGAYRP